MKSFCDNPECKKEYAKNKPWQRFCSSKCKKRLRTMERKDVDYYREYLKHYKHTPVFKYNVQKQGSKRRGIEFSLSFDEWWSYWEGKWDKRGKTKDSLVMCRFGDKGGYEVGNVYIDTYSNNSILGCKLQNQKKSSITGRFISENN
jgi:hypothetical protein